MNWQSVYNNLISKAQNRILKGYFETHHILPRSMGGTDDACNLVNLTAREHFVAHLLLTRIHPNTPSVWYAFWRMCNSKSPEFKPTSRQYEEARAKAAHFSSSRVVTEETRRKLSAAAKGRKNPKYPRELIEKLILNGQSTRFVKGQTSPNKGKKMSADTLSKRSASRQGYCTSDETKQKISLALKGHKKPPRSSSWSDKQSAAKKGVPRKDRFTCSNCAREIGGISNFRRHNSSCVHVAKSE